MRSFLFGSAVVGVVALQGCSCGSDIKVTDEQNSAPSAIINAPDDEALFLENETIEFFGTVADANGLDDIQSVVWDSSIEGEMAVVTVDPDGSVRHNQTLLPGTHTITLTATDSEGGIAQDAITVIVQPEISDEGTQAILQKMDGVLDETGATRLMCSDLGKRKLAYEVREFQKGHYYVLSYLDDGKVVGDLERALRIEESVLRFMTVKVEEEVTDIEARKAEVEAVHRRGSGRLVLLYQDEMSYYRQPTLAQAWAGQGCGGHHQGLARQSHRSNTRARLGGCLNALTGQVHFRQRSKMGVDQLLGLYRAVVAAYPEAETIYLVQDNWPVHFHPRLLAQLEPQQWPWPFYVPAEWQKMAAVAPATDPLPLQLLCLPTYASWLNPIEQLWRLLRQEVLHLHRMSDAWGELKQRVAAFLEQFLDGSMALLRYVGLLPD